MQFKRVREEDLRLIDASMRFNWSFQLGSLSAATSSLNAMWARYNALETDIQAPDQPVMDVTLLGSGDAVLKEDLARKFNFSTQLFEEYDCEHCIVLSLASRLVRSGVRASKGGLLISFSDGWNIQMSSRSADEMQRVWPLDNTEGSVVRRANTGFIQADAGLIVLGVEQLVDDSSYTSATLDSTIASLGRLEASLGAMMKLREDPRLWFTSLQTTKVPIITCTIERGEFTYSTNPTFTSESELERSLDDNPINIRTYVSSKNVSRCTTFITRIGIYDSNRRLLAIAKMPATRNDNSKVLKFDVPLFLRQ